MTELNDDPAVGTLWEDDPYRHTETVYLSDLTPEIQALIRAGLAAKGLVRGIGELGREATVHEWNDSDAATFVREFCSDLLTAYQTAIGGDRVSPTKAACDHRPCKSWCGGDE